jgi:hypothetical protein
MARKDMSHSVDTLVQELKRLKMNVNRVSTLGKAMVEGGKEVP